MICKNCKSDEPLVNGRCPYCRTEYNEEIITNKNEVEKIKEVSTIPLTEPPTTTTQDVVSEQNTKKKSNKKILLILLVIIVTITTFFVISKPSNKSVENKKDTDTQKEVQEEKPKDNKDKKKTDRTIMIYLMGSDLERKYKAATLDVQEMFESNFNTEDVSLLIYAGGTTNWRNSYFEEEENAIYEVQGEELKKLKTYKLKLMSNPETLTEFLDFTYDNYDSKRYSLILWDHGAGPVRGYGWDENDKSQDLMSLTEINKALNDSKLIQKKKLEFLGFDACLMSSLEIANMFKEEANFLISSADIEPGQGWDYNFLSDITAATTTESLGISIINYYYDYYYNETKNSYSAYGYNRKPEITLSLVDLSKIDGLIEGVNKLFNNLNPNLTPTTYSNIARSASKAFMYAYDSERDYQEDVIDLYGLVEGIEGNQSLVTEVQTELQKAIIYHKTNIKGCHGMSIYFPITTKTFYDEYIEFYDYENSAFSEEYLNFLRSYTNISSGDRLVTSDISTTNPVITNNDIKTTIPEDIASNYETVDYVVFRKIQDDGSYLPIFVSDDVAIDGTTISATVSNKRIAIKDNDGKITETIAIEKSRDEESVTYVLPAILSKWDDKSFIDTYELENVNLYVRVDNKTGVGELTDIKVSSDNYLESAKNIINLNEWRTIQFLSSSYKLYDESGKKLEEWLKTPTMYGTEVEIKDGINFISTTLDKEEEYYYMFRIKDTQNNVYETNLVKSQ